MGPQGPIISAVLLFTLSSATAVHAASYPAYAEVVHVAKIVRQQHTRTPVKRCTWEQLPSRVHYPHRYGEHRVIERRAKRCRTRYENRTIEQVSGYNVTLRYNGESFTRRMQTHPGTRVPVTIDISPQAQP